MTRRGLLTAVLIGGATARLGAQDVVFSSKVEAVRVDVLVTEREKGGPVVGLGPDDFEILDNGVPQQVDLVSFEQIPLNVILAFDASESVAGDRLEQLRNASAGLLGTLTKDDQAGLVTFTQRVVLGSGLTKDLDAVRQAMGPVANPGETSIVDATYSGIMLGESDVGRGLLIVFSDGVDTASWLTPDMVLNTARRSDIVVYAVSAQSRLKPEFLQELTAATGGRLYEVEKTANLESVFLSVLEEFRHRYLVSYTPQGVDPDGWHRLVVNIKGRKATVKARPGYLAGS
jgi:Ca-activated chloride channel family protein